MRILVLTSRRIESRQSGYDLRVAHLCAHLPGEAHLVIAPLQPTGDPRPGLETDALFESIEELSPVMTGVMSVRRHLRLSDDHYLERTYPAAFALARSRLREIVRAREITHVVVFGGDVAELAGTLDHPHVLLDVCDSTALTARRTLTGSAHPARGLRRWKDRLALHRKSATEARFPSRFERVITISEPDARAVEGRHGVRGAVATIPNGVDESFSCLPEPGTRRGVVFWGNLAFGPNRDALWFFVHEVFLPTLRDAGVELCVVGSDAPDWLSKLAAREPRIVLTGFVDDLTTLVTRYPIMVNPMCTGSGLKNKVLEAFGLGLVVVSTPLGVEALPQLEDGTHVVCADDAAGFGSGVLTLLDDEDHRRSIRAAAHTVVHDHYRWEVVGRAWQGLFRIDQSRTGHTRS